MTISSWLRALGSTMLTCVSMAASAADTLSVAVVPQFPPEQIHRTWSPVLQAWSAASGLKLQLKVYASIPEFEADFLTGAPDIAYMNPYHVVMASPRVGYVPILRDDQSRLKGILVVRNDGPITDVKQLDGGNIAFPAPNAFGASLYMRALLTEQARIRYTPSYVKTHSNVYRHVLSGQAVAGGGVVRTLNDEPEGVRSNLRVIYETPSAYPHPIVVHPRVSTKDRGRLQKAFLAMAADPAKRKLLNDIQMPQPVPANLSEYAPLLKLGLERYVVLKQD